MAYLHNPIFKAYGYVLPKWQRQGLMLEKGDLGHIFVTFVLAVPPSKPVAGTPIPLNKGKFFLITIYGNRAIKFYNEVRCGDYVRVSCDVSNATWYYTEEKEYQHNKGVSLKVFKWKKVEPESCRKAERISQKDIIAIQEGNFKFEDIEEEFYGLGETNEEIEGDEEDGEEE